MRVKRELSCKNWIRFLCLIVLLGLSSNSYALTSIRLATTTSLDNSGLLEAILPFFEERYGIRVHVIAVGTGKALKLAENGDVDLILVHDPEGEEKFMEKGFGVERRTFMFNHFIIVGPVDDPAKIRGVRSATQAFQQIAENKSIFVSRGDNSGTHKKELSIWRKIGLTPKGSWYMETGQGMGATLLIADEKNGYCLTDEGTFFAYQDKIGLVILAGGDSSLKNPYSVIAVNPIKYPQVKYREAKLFINWLTSKETKEMIKGFKIREKRLFYPIDK